MPPRPRPTVKPVSSDSDYERVPSGSNRQRDRETRKISWDDSQDEYERHSQPSERASTRARRVNAAGEGTGLSTKVVPESTSLDTTLDDSDTGFRETEARPRDVHANRKTSGPTGPSQRVSSGADVNGYDNGLDDGSKVPTKSDRVSVRDTSPNVRESYKRQGRTSQNDVARDSGSEDLTTTQDRERLRTVQRSRRGHDDRTTRGGQDGFGPDISPIREAKRADHFRSKLDLTPERARNAYLSPPPTEKRSLQVPDTPRGRIPRKTTRKPVHEHVSSLTGDVDPYTLMTSDEEPAVRVKRGRRRPVPVGDVVDITSDSDFPSRLTAPMQLKFRGRVEEEREDSDRDRPPPDLDSDEDEHGNLRGFVVSDDDILDKPPSRKSKQPRIVDSSGSKGLPDSDNDDKRSQSNRSSRRDNDLRDVGQRPLRGTQSSVKRDKAVVAKTNAGEKVELLFRSGKPSDKGKKRVRSPSPESDNYVPASKRISRATANEQLVADSRNNDGDRSKRKRSNSIDEPDRAHDQTSLSAVHKPETAENAGRSSLSPSPADRYKRQKNSNDGDGRIIRPLVETGKCRVTREEDHDGFLLGTYGKLPAYLSTSILRTPQETGAVGLSYFNNVENGLPLFDTDNLCIKRLRALLTLRECAAGKVIVPSRADPDLYAAEKYVTTNNKAIFNLVRDGDQVDVVIFGFVAQDGSWLERLASPSGERAPQNQCYHALSVYPLNGEYQRTLAFLHHVFAPANQKCQMYTTGNAWQAATMWGDRGKYQGRKPLPGHVRVNAGEGSSARAARGVHPALSRSVKSYNADIPVFDSRRHFYMSHVPENWRDDFSPENILTQADSTDVRFTGEIPVDSLVAMHCVCSMRPNGAVSLNLIGVQVLVTPKGVFYSDVQ